MSDKQGWTGGPSRRGTFDILWTCVSTLALCVWTAVHPNILLVPSTKRSLLMRLGMMIIAIVFPEVIISLAWRQLRSAQWLRTKINYIASMKNGTLAQNQSKSYQTPKATKTISDAGSQRSLLPKFEVEADSEDVASPPKGSVHLDNLKNGQTEDVTRSKSDSKPLFWNSEQAFFAVMGGFAVETEYFDEHDRKVTLRRIVTVDGVLQLARLGLIPAIEPEDISERSKADIIAKAFVLSQITWFALQVIGRLASDIPVTPLEIHTLIHVACTIIMYFLWMKKPYDLRGSVLLTNPRTKAIAALCNFYTVSTELHAESYMEYQKARANYWKDRVVRAANNLLDHDPPPEPPMKELLTEAVGRYIPYDNRPLIASTDSKYHILASLAPSAQCGIDTLREHGGGSNHAINHLKWDLLRETSENFAIKAVWGGWSTNTGHEMSLDKGVHFLFNFLYGAGHLSAWASSSFPTSIEHYLWIASAFMLTSIPLLGALWILWWKAVSSQRKWLYLVRNGDLDVLAAPFFFVAILAYFLARCYFLVESLISLRLLPVGAFLTVNWARYLPHVA